MLNGRISIIYNIMHICMCMIVYQSFKHFVNKKKTWVTYSLALRESFNV